MVTTARVVNEPIQEALLVALDAETGTNGYSHKGRTLHRVAAALGYPENETTFAMLGDILDEMVTQGAVETRSSGRGGTATSYKRVGTTTTSFFRYDPAQFWQTLQRTMRALSDRSDGWLSLSIIRRAVLVAMGRTRQIGLDAALTEVLSAKIASGEVESKEADGGILYRLKQTESTASPASEASISGARGAGRQDEPPVPTPDDTRSAEQQEALARPTNHTASVSTSLAEAEITIASLAAKHATLTRRLSILEEQLRTNQELLTAAQTSAQQAIGERDQLAIHVEELNHQLRASQARADELPANANSLIAHEAAVRARTLLEALFAQLRRREQDLQKRLDGDGHDGVGYKKEDEELAKEYLTLVSGERPYDPTRLLQLRGRMDRMALQRFHAQEQIKLLKALLAFAQQEFRQVAFV